MKKLFTLLLSLCLLLPAAGLGEDFLVVDGGDTATAATTEPASTESLAGAVVTEASDETLYTAALAELDAGSLLNAVNDFTKLGAYGDASQYAAYAYALLLRLREQPAQAEEQFQSISGFLDSDYQLALTKLSCLHRSVQNGKYGYVDARGVWRIPPQFDWAERVFRIESAPSHSRDDADWEDTELCMVAVVFNGQTEVTDTDRIPVSGRYGLIRSDGRMVFPVQYTEILWAKEGYAAATDGTYAYLADVTAGIEIGDAYEAIGEYAQGVVPVKQNGLWGYYNPETSTMLGQGYVWETALPFSEGLAAVSLEGKYGYVDLTGQTVIPLQYDGAASFSEGLAGVRVGKKWGFINRANELAIKPAYTEVRAFQCGLCAVAKSGKWGFVDTAGTIVLRLKYAEVTDCDPVSQRAWFRQNKLWGLLSAGGTVILKPTWSFHDDFAGNTLCRVAYKNQYGFIDVSGKTRIASDYTAASSYRAELAAVEDASGEIHYVDKMQRGFAVDTDVPTECLRGFIEAREVWETTQTTTDETGATQTLTQKHILFSLYDTQGNPINVQPYAASDAQP
jgi:hypothetical protein